MNVVQLKREINTKRAKWDERSSFTICGVKNLSVSDLDTLELYIDFYNRGIPNELMKPRGNIETLLVKAGVDRNEFGN